MRLGQTQKLIAAALVTTAVAALWVATGRDDTGSVSSAPARQGGIGGSAGRTLDPSQFKKDTGYSPYAGRNYPTRAYFGDQHLHTSWSGDAVAGGTTLGPEEAIRFALGEEILTSTGQRAQLGTPLDWIVISDHSDGYGTINELKSGNAEMMRDSTLRRWRDMMLNADRAQGQAAMMQLAEAQARGTLPAAIMDPKLLESVWARNIEIQERYNAPGRFTTLIGYEWTSNAGRNTFHRNVIFRDGGARAGQVAPMTTFDSENPEDLWKWMEAYEARTGGRVLAIPHNGNLSNGRMFEESMFSGAPMTREYAEARQRWEPLYEVLQMKGQGESHPSLSPTDEFAVGYEIWDMGNLVLEPKQPGMIQHEYLREALKNGLKIEAAIGANPFRIGMVGGTDSHNGLTGEEENNYFSKFPITEPRPDRWNEDAVKFGDRVVKGWQLSAAGRTGVWATGNTREELWDAMQRRETFATSGPHISVRFFGGYDFTRSDILSRDPAAAGYAKGVPMGGDLQRAPAGKAPTFLIAATKDPRSGNLDRIQVIKGWLDASGRPQERIYDVVWSEPNRRRITNGRLTPVGNTVDVATASWTNTIGASELLTVWRDPDFDPSVRAFYYLRVLEIPTPRWTAYDAAYFRVRMDPQVPMITQERAFTSPIWYRP